MEALLDIFQILQSFNNTSNNLDHFVLEFFYGPSEIRTYDRLLWEWSFLHRQRPKIKLWPANLEVMGSNPAKCEALFQLFTKI